MIGNVENWTVGRVNTLSFPKTILVHNINRKH